MSNYNERLDELLNTLGERHIMVEHRLIHLGMPEQNGKNIETIKAKQAITSLIKELVEGAKPDNAEILPEDYDMSGDYNHVKRMRNATIDQFEQNLLKALEEV